MRTITVKREGVPFTVQFFYDHHNELQINRIESARGDDMTALEDYLNLRELVEQWDQQNEWEAA